MTRFRTANHHRALGIPGGISDRTAPRTAELLAQRRL